MLRSILRVSQVLWVSIIWFILLAGGASAQGFFDGRFVLTRFTSEGHVDNDFGDRGILWTAFPHIFAYMEQAHGEALAIDREGRTVEAGWASVQAGGRSQIAIVRRLSDGRLDPSFGKSGRVVREFGEEKFSRALAVAIDRVDGSIAVAGEVGDQPGATRMAVALYLDNGKPAPYFGGGLVQPSFDDVQISSGRAVAIDKHGKIIVAGYAKHQGQAKFALARCERDGSLDTDFGSKGTMVTPFSQEYPGVLDARANAVAIDDKGRIVVAGTVRGPLKHAMGDADQGFGLARYTPDGQLDVSFGKNGVIATPFGPKTLAEATAFVIERDAILAAGTVTSGTEIQFGLASYDENGKHRRRFNNKVTLVVPWDHNVSSCAMVVQPNGQIVIGGTVHADPPTFGIARLHSDGKLDSDFGIGGRCEYEPVFWSDAKVGGIVLDDKDILVAGYGKTVDRLPECGAVPEIRLELDWDFSEEEIPELINLCYRFYNSVYDALDGQLGIERFSIVDNSVVSEPWKYDWEFEQPPSLQRVIVRKDPAAWSEVLVANPSEEDPYPGRPDKPDPLVLSACSVPSWADCSRSMFRLWCTAYTGTALEWMFDTSPVNHNCILGNPSMASPWGDAISPWGLCRGKSYHPQTLQGQLRGMSCYDWMVKILGFPGMTVPTTNIVGPIFPQATTFVVRGHEILPAAMLPRLCEYEKIEGLVQIDPQVIEGLILRTPEGEKITIGLSANSRREKDPIGHTNGKLIVEYEGEEIIESLHLFFKQYHDGNYLSSLDQDEVGFSVMSGDYDDGSYSREQLQKSKSAYRVEVSLQNVKSIEWQYWKGVRFGKSFPWCGLVWNAQTEVDFLVKVGGEEYSLRIRGYTPLGWDTLCPSLIDKIPAPW
jgi:uncharacterized delta-60 repeat protein